MFARITTVTGSPEQIDIAVKLVNETIIPEARGLEGFKGGTWLGNRTIGKVVSVTFWATEEDMEASEKVAHRLRSLGALTISGTVTSVEHMEVLAQA